VPVGFDTVATEFAGRGYALGVASNYDHRLRSVAAGLPEFRLLPHLMISAEIGWRKPAREFFTAVCTQVNLDAECVLLVGDDWNNDIVGARAAGLHAILLDPKERYEPTGVTRIRQLQELLA
jgi:putative hydrolase of the HAD superfamily